MPAPEETGGGGQGESVVTCPGCGRANIYAQEDGYTDEHPREWHSGCAYAAERAADLEAERREAAMGG